MSEIADTQIDNIYPVEPDGPIFETIKFTGSGSEYFRVWIVNLVLTIITFGVYSAWAKVRNTQYVYSNTHINGSAFDYLANPVALLIGRIIAAVYFFILYFVAKKLELGVTQFWIITYMILLGILILVTPWIIVKALRFKARNTAYRNVRFNFKKKYRQSYGVYLGWWFLSMISFGLLVPLYWARQQHFIMKNLGYGATQFDYDLQVKPFYILGLKLLGIIIAGFALIYLIVYILIIQAGMGPQGPAPGQQVPGYFIISIVIGVYGPMLLAIAILSALYKSHLANIVWNKTSLSAIDFRSSLKTGELFSIYVKNALMILITFGLYIPWAKMNVIDYRLSQTQVSVSEDFDNFVNETEKQQQSSFAEGMDDVFGFEISL